MSRTPRLTGSDLIAVLVKAGFRVLRVKGIISCAMRMAEARLCLRIQARRSVLAYFTRSFEIAKSPPNSSVWCDTSRSLERLVADERLLLSVTCATKPAPLVS
jgi:hypothetical protein